MRTSFRDSAPFWPPKRGPLKALRSLNLAVHTPNHIFHVGALSLA